MAGCTVPGFDVDQLLGRGWGGELWAARGRATGRPVVLRRIAVADDVATHDRVRRAAARLVGVAHPHVVGLRGVLSTPGAVVLVHDHVAGVGLERVLVERRRLTDSEVVTLAVPLAQALAAVHACGLVHGRVSPGSVLLDDDGRPMLADTGVAALVEGCDGSTCPPDDVRDLALTCLAALGPAGQVGPLATVLSAATSADASRRPSAAELASAIFASAPAAPIQPTAAPATARPTQRGGVQPDPARLAGRRPRSHRRTSRRPGWRASRRWAGLLGALAAATAAALSGLAWAGADRGATGSTVAAPAHASSYDVAAMAGRWRSLLVALDGRRAAAFAAASPGRLTDVYAAGAPALRRDRARLADLAAAGMHVEGLQLRPRSVHVVTSAPRRVVLTVVDVLEPYSLRTARGDLVDTRPGRAAETWRVTLVRDHAGWRIFDVVSS
jgi:hypothetical protein